jgi:hypothetical protein
MLEIAFQGLQISKIFPGKHAPGRNDNGQNKIIH